MTSASLPLWVRSVEPTTRRHRPLTADSRADVTGEADETVQLVLVGAVTLSETAVVYLQFGRQRWQFSLTEGVVGAA